MPKRGWITGGLAALAALTGLGMARPVVADPVVSTVTLAQNPTAIAIDARTGRAFVATADPIANASAVAVFDTASGRLLTTTHIGLNAGQNPGPLAVDERAGRVLVVNGDGNNVSVLDARNGRLIHTTRVAGTPQLLAIDQRSGRAFVSTLSGTVVEIDSATGQTLHIITVSDVPTALAVDDRAGRAFAGTVDGTLETINTRSGTIMHVAALGEGVRLLAVDRRASRVFAIGSDISNYGAAYSYGSGSDVLCLLDATTGSLLSSASIPVLSTVLTLDEQRGRAYVVSPLSYRVSIFDSHSGAAIGTINTGFIPGPMIVDARSGRGVVIAQNATRAIVFDAGSGLAPQSVSLAGPHQRLVNWLVESAALDARSGRVVIAMDNGHASRAVVLDTRRGSVARTIGVGVIAADVAVDEQSSRVVLVGTTVTTPQHQTALDAVEQSLSRVLGHGASPLNHWLDSLIRWFPFSAPTAEMGITNIGSVTVLNTGAAGGGQ